MVVPLMLVLQSDVPAGVTTFNPTVTWVWAVLKPGCFIFVICIHYLCCVVRLSNIGEVFVVAPGVVNFALAVLAEDVSFAIFPEPVVVFAVAVGHVEVPCLSSSGKACLLNCGTYFCV